jgi:hypothetical protein
MNERRILSQINDTLVKITPNNLPTIKEKLMKREKEEMNTVKSLLSKGFRIAAVACLLVILAGTVTVAANKLTGADFFHMFYPEESSQNADNQVYMGLDQYREISSSTVGTVVDTDEIIIEVLGAVATGNVSSVMLRITAKQLDTVLINNGILLQGNYCFNDSTGGSLFKDFEDASYRYYYSVEEEDLQPNQFDILYTVIKKETVTEKQYTIEFNNFGYFSKNNGFVTLYNNKWDILIDFDTEADYTKTINLDKEILIDNKYVTVNQISVTPFSCSIDIQGRILEDSDIVKILHELDELNDELTIQFNDTIIIDKNSFTHSAMGGRADKDGTINQEGIVYYHSTIMFNKPILVNNIEAIVFHGEKHNLK